MLDANALAQLNQLKKQIKDTQDRRTGIVRGTNGRFGFVCCTDENGREEDVFLAPEEMNKVLPGDQVEVLVSTDKNDRKSGVIEKLKRSDQHYYFGKYREKGNNHFVDVELNPGSRWLFVPPPERAPKARHNAVDGSFVKVKLIKHPYPNGRAQVSIETHFGDAATPGIEARYTAARHQLTEGWSEQARAEADDALKAGAQHADLRTDRTDLPLVTIDSVSTLDMDDAVFAECTENGWRLYVAIADPDAYVEANSALDNEAFQRGTSVYLTGNVIPMLPPALSQQACSLVAGEIRPALLCAMDIDRAGNIVDSSFSLASIRSHGKLNYEDVANALDNGEHHYDEPTINNLQALRDLFNARKHWRTRCTPPQENRADYYLVLNEQKKVSEIKRVERNIAHTIIEECMLSTNQCAAQFLASNKTGLFSVHAGFRPEQSNELLALIREMLPELGDLLPDSLDNYVAIMQAASQLTNAASVRTAINRRLQNAALTTEAAPHFGLGLPTYATVTSPIRRYSDLVNLRQIKLLLGAENSGPQPSQAMADSIGTSFGNARQASNAVENWLKLEWLSRQPALHNREMTAQIRSFGNGGIGIWLDDWGLYSFIDLRKSKPKFTLDTLRLQATMGERSFAIGDSISVKLNGVNLDTMELHASLSSNASPQEK